jgi:hypothetical protein
VQSRFRSQSSFGRYSVRGSPHGDFTDQGLGWLAARRHPQLGSVSLAGLATDLIGEVGDELGAVIEVPAPDRMIADHSGRAGEPGQRTGIGGCGGKKTQIQDRGLIRRCLKFAPISGYLQLVHGTLAGRPSS